MVGGLVLIEREAEVAALDELIESAGRGDGSLLLINGSAGVGKSSLLAAALRSAGVGLKRSASARGSELETPLSFGIARQLLEQLLPEGELPRSASLVALRSGEAPAREFEELELLHAVYRVVADLADEGPLLIAVDDLHWADTPSLRLLLYLVQRLPRMPVAVVATRRLGEKGPGDHLLDRLALDPACESVRLEPLSAAGSAELVRATLDAATARFTEACHRVSGGNPFYLRELLLSLGAEGVEPTSDAAKRVERMTPEGVLLSTLVQLERLGDATRPLARAVAVLGEDAALRRAAQLANLSYERASEAADSLVASGLLGPGEPLTFNHPLLRSTVAADLPDGERALAHRRAAELLAGEGAPADRVAAHLLASPRAADPWVAEQLLQAARRAWRHGAADSAVTYLRRAMDEPPPAERRADVLVELGEAEALAGEEGAIERLEEALALPDDPARRATVLFRLGALLYRAGRLSDACRAYGRGVEACPAEHELYEVLRTSWLAMLTLTTGPDIAPLEEAAQRPVASGPAQKRAERERLVHGAWARVLCGESAAAAQELAKRALGEGAMLREDGLSWTFSFAASCLTWTEAHEESDREIGMAIEMGRSFGSPVLLAYMLFGRCQLRYWQGRMPETAADAGAAVEAWRGGWSMHLPATTYYQALALIELGDLDGADAALRIGEDVGPSEELSRGVLAAGRGRLALARNDPADAVAHYATAAESAVMIVGSYAAAPWRPWAALAHARAGDSRAAADLVAEEHRRAERFGTARAIAGALRAAGLIERGERGIELLEEAVSTLDGSPAVLELARARVDLGALLRASGRRAEAREPLRAGLELARRLGARAIADRARGELGATGARLPDQALSGVESLTPSERRVAELAAGGLSNPAIADELFVVRKTVEWHLQHVYRKLEIGSRDELAGALA